MVSNAIKFTPPGGSIRVQVAAEPGAVHFRVQDRGAGFPEAAKERLFERHWQATPGHGQGLGLGLYIARALVEAHGGRIRAESAPGEGSTFHFTLPR
nr:MULTISPECIES: ATP-binding protein [Myxococcaceae]